MGESSASGSGRFEATSHLLLLRPDDSLTILTMALSIGIRVSVSLPSAIQATRLLTVTSVGLSPTEHTNLDWTRSHKAVYGPNWSKLLISCNLYCILVIEISPILGQQS